MAYPLGPGADIQSPMSQGTIYPLFSATYVAWMFPSWRRLGRHCCGAKGRTGRRLGRDSDRPLAGALGGFGSFRLRRWGGKACGARGGDRGWDGVSARHLSVSGAALVLFDSLVEGGNERAT